ncbi:hypothetical protein BC937DRAFT_93011 [Endogone sp. FLAS-F59071]|nr:hypothetical protein BC937DRAFT_93011 [Endogone sp. FLAS-F59071]|eukprot:RUS23056.1 hypothetical protein BC937DRAFT_93011 [Endogone sp. FLAS-F59071]
MQYATYQSFGVHMLIQKVLKRRSISNLGQNRTSKVPNAQSFSDPTPTTYLSFFDIGVSAPVPKYLIPDPNVGVVSSGSAASLYIGGDDELESRDIMSS